MKSRQAHVVGAGLAGLAVAACLAQRKWTVTVHEADAGVAGDWRRIGKSRKTRSG